MDMSTPLLPKVIPEIDANPVIFFGMRGWGRSWFGASNDSYDIDLRNRIQGLLKRLYRAGYIKYYMSFADLSIEVSQNLFSNIQRPHHCLNHLLPASRPLDTLRPRGHNALPVCYSMLHKKSFIVNCLYRFV